MNGLMSDLGEVEAVVTAVTARPRTADVLICTPSPLIARAAQIAAGRIGIGGQDCHSATAGAFTGDVSAEMLKDAGASAVIVGHSERRQHHGENDATVAAKADAAWRAGLLVIICIGETRAQRNEGAALSVCGEQLAGSIPEGGACSARAVAYEPLWAFLAVISQSVACSQHHDIEQRLACLLLTLNYYAGSHGFPMVQESMAALLGVRRAGVSGAAGKLQAQGLMRYRRGRISNVEARRLEKVSCECYRFIRQQYAQFQDMLPLLLSRK